VRIYVDGALDLIHSGHYNALRQAKSLGDILVVGVNSDEEILKNKGPTILTCKERADIIRSCKWVDEVYEGTEYTVTEEILDRYKCQFYAHGDDPVYNSEGVDMCALLKEKGRLKIFKRTEGVSTTNIVGKLLSLSHESITSERKGSFDKPLKPIEYVKQMRLLGDDVSVGAPEFPKSQFLATTRRIIHFSNRNEPKPGDRIIYIDGSFDLLHNGHIERLAKAKLMGDFLYVGLWDDDVISRVKGFNYPILSLQERALMVLANRSVDDIVIGAPLSITEDLIKSLGIHKVVQAKGKEMQSIDQYKVPKEKEIFELLEVECKMSVDSIAKRVIANRENYQKKFDKKHETQKEYEKQKVYVAESFREQ